MKSEFLTTQAVDDVTKEKAGAFIKIAKNVARKMAANYNQKKKAYELANERFASTGSLDLNRIGMYRTSDEIFKKKKMIKEGKSHGMVCPVDFSASMSSILTEVAMQFLIIALFGKYTEIPFIMYSFTSNSLSLTRSNPRPWAWEIESIYSSYGNNANSISLVTLASDSLSVSEIINNFYHILSVSQVSSYNRTYFSEKYKNFLYEYFYMNGTPLYHASMQAAILAKEMKDAGIQNVNIFTISDGMNNTALINNESGKSVEATSIQCPYTNRVYTVNDDAYSFDKAQMLMNPINKMTRGLGIKTYNIFINENLHHQYTFNKMFGTYVKYHDEAPNKLYSWSFKDDMLNNMKANYFTEIDNLWYYNKVIMVSTDIFPGLPTIGFDDSEVTDKISPTKFIRESTNASKSLSILGRLISDILIEDFKLVNKS